MRRCNFTPTLRSALHTMHRNVATTSGAFDISNAFPSQPELSLGSLASFAAHRASLDSATLPPRREQRLNRRLSRRPRALPPHLPDTHRHPRPGRPPHIP